MNPEEINGHLIWQVYEAPRELGQLVCSRCANRFLDKVGVINWPCPRNTKRTPPDPGHVRDLNGGVP